MYYRKFTLRPARNLQKEFRGYVKTQLMQCFLQVLKHLKVNGRCIFYMEAPIEYNVVRLF